MTFEYGTDNYNYVDFVLRNEMQPFVNFRDRLHVGEKAPDFELHRLDDGETLKLSNHWTDTHCVIEFGSFT